MKTLNPLAFDIAKCQAELAELQALLAKNAQLSESKQILPFFRTRHHLSAFIASSFSKIDCYDRIAHEFDIFGDFTADLVVGDSNAKRFVFIEFEDAKPESIFTSKQGRSTPDWSFRVEHGISQILDWFWKLSEEKGSTEFITRFGAPSIRIFGLVVVGRRALLSHREQERLKWREDSVLCDSKNIQIITFDDLADDLAHRLKYRK